MTAERPFASPDERPSGPRRLGVIGSFVWDVIYGRDARRAPIEEWGGVTYALSALDAALTNDWQVVPLVKVGADLAARAREFLRGLRRIAPDAEPIIVPVQNNRVELRYTSEERRSEVLTGGVPPWHWLGLKPLLRDIDALYINLLSGFELDLEVAQLIRQHFRGPIYCDLHSLLLAVQPGGLRTPRPLVNAEGWLRCFDLVQVNEDEMRLIAPDPMALAATAMNCGVSSLVVTLGARGVVYVNAPGFQTLDDAGRRGAAAFVAGAVETARVPADRVRVKGPEQDPTGCGDVFGATLFARLVCGDTFSVALPSAVRAAARNVEFRGASGLAHHLRGELIPS
ncbi:MAG: carbohydrate kinase family protein [Gemmatimonadaceae bacterium]|nr:carbohydrate kinase family protein [Gemmatimonadaceae bacterium]